MVLDVDSAFTVLSSVATAIAAVAACASWRAAVTSNNTSQSLAKLEQERRHSELRPVFVVSFAAGTNTNTPILVVKLDGPAGLDKLDSIEITIRGNKRMVASPSGMPTVEDIAKQIWGPFRFSPRVDGASADGRKVPYSNLLLGDEAKFQLEKVPAPSWNTQNAGNEWWEMLGISPSLKISIFCKNANFGTWTVPWELLLK